MDRDTQELIAALLAGGPRWLVWGPSGAGKSTLVAALADALVARGLGCVAVAADPGSPGFGVPGVIARGRRRNGGWETERIEALCALDAVRHRLPLVLALGRLLADMPPGAASTTDAASLPSASQQALLLVDAPGVVRGPAAGELLAALVETARADGVLAILPEEGVEREAALTLLATVAVPVRIEPVSPLARRRGKHERAAARTALWDAWLETAEPVALDLARLRLTGGAVALSDWQGRQVALLGATGVTLGLGEAVERVGDGMHVRLRRTAESLADAAALLVRDVRRDASGLLTTEGRGQGGATRVAIPPELATPGRGEPDPACFVHLGQASALLVNGIFGDPLLHIRLRQQRRSLLFDLGDSTRLPAKIAHQVSDVFISHAHMDHIGGFLWFLRSRIGEMGRCRLYGPPGLAEHIAAFIGGIHWDRIGDRGPHFEVHELDGDRVRVSRLQVGLGAEETHGLRTDDGTLLVARGFRVRAVTLDHGIPVLAFAFETTAGVRIRKDRLAAAGLPDGPWLGDLKRRLLAVEEGARVSLPDGRSETAGRLALDLVAREPARRLIYATDLADTAENRARLVGLARGADVLICEAAFTAVDAVQAGRTGHLTARACGEIGAAAGVGRLVPFHFSRRYETRPEQVYAEVRTAFGRELTRQGATPGDSGSELH